VRRPAAPAANNDNGRGHPSRRARTTSTALAAGVRGDLSEGERAQKFSGHSLRAGLASSAEVDERYVQKQLGHASADVTVSASI
jgi:integrase